MEDRSAKASHSVVALLREDIDLGVTLLEIAGVSEAPETIARNHATALKAYRTVEEYINAGRLTPEDAHSLFVAAKPLRDRLTALGDLDPSV